VSARLPVPAIKRLPPIEQQVINTSTICCAGCGQLNAVVSASRQMLHCRIIRHLVLFLKGVDKDAIPGSLRVGGGINNESANRLPRLNSLTSSL